MEQLKKGLPTPTGKFELKSELIARHPEWGLDPLPTYRAPVTDTEAKEYPMLLCTGSRIPNAIHSRLHDVEWERSLHPVPTAEISEPDARRLGIAEGDTVEITTSAGSLCMKAQVSSQIAAGQVYLFHGYREADANLLTSGDNLDPYSGFPGYRSTACKIARKD